MSEQDLAIRLSPLMPEDSFPLEWLGGGTKLARLSENWAVLEAMGFQLELKPNSLRAVHREKAFETAFSLTGADEPGIWQAVYEDMRRAFGGFADRYFSWILQSSDEVTKPYRCLKEVVGVLKDADARSRAD